jgi:hypothetical protein
LNDKRNAFTLLETPNAKTVEGGFLTFLEVPIETSVGTGDGTKDAVPGWYNWIFVLMLFSMALASSTKL